jgi:hypothetical protein
MAPAPAPAAAPPRVCARRRQSSGRPAPDAIFSCIIDLLDDAQEFADERSEPSARIERYNKISSN